MKFDTEKLRSGVRTIGAVLIGYSPFAFLSLNHDNTAIGACMVVGGIALIFLGSLKTVEQ